MSTLEQEIASIDKMIADIDVHLERHERSLASLKAHRAILALKLEVSKLPDAAVEEKALRTIGLFYNDALVCAKNNRANSPRPEDKAWLEFERAIKGLAEHLPVNAVPAHIEIER
jgi:hypothetical protein